MFGIRATVGIIVSHHFKMTAITAIQLNSLHSKKLALATKQITLTKEQSIIISLRKMKGVNAETLGMMTTRLASFLSATKNCTQVPFGTHTHA